LEDPLLKKTLHINSLDEWRELCLKCRRCPLHKGARNVVFGEGDPHARIMFIGEGPGGEEDRLGRPFVGAAGKLLDRIFSAAGWRREELYIANIVKCRPPGNRNPLQEEIETCYPLLVKQIELIDPPIIVTLGAVAAKVLLDSRDFYITRERGKWRQLGSRMLMPTFHPAALLRDPSKKRPVWEDIKQVMALYKEYA
jgi:uracil-DNA glycosylase family 4